MKQSLTYIEIDIPFCANDYGVAPCTASIPATGPAKCFNSIKTCQDRVHFAETTVTLRFAKPTDYLPKDISAIPSILTVEFTPAIISLGENLGQRATLSVTFLDHRHSDTGQGYDKYLSSRDYDPFSQGTFWGKFRARQPFLRGRSIRWITGLVGDALQDMETRHFIIDSFDGPSPDGKYTLVGKDVLKLADGDRSQAPLLSNGFLVSDITSAAGEAILSPSGIGNAEYPLSGFVAIGGNEVVSFNRAGDILAIARAQLGSIASAHRAQDRVQLVLQYTGEDAANIINHLLVFYAGVPGSYIAIDEWRAETAAFLGNVYTGNICEPTSVATLCSELIEQAALALWWDDVNQKIRLQVLRGILTDADRFTPDNTIGGSLAINEQPDTRLSQVRVYFGQINPTRPLSDLDNFRSSTVTTDQQAEDDYGSAAIKTINSRWIPALGRTVAARLGAIQVGRFRDPPRRVTFDLMRYAETDVSLGNGYRMESQCVQDATGAQADIPVQVTRLNPGPDKFSVEAQEMLFMVPEIDLTNRIMIVDANNFNINLRAAHDSIYPVAQAGDVVTCTINAGVIVGSLSASVAAFDVGLWPAGVTLNLIVLGRIQGHGGAGGAGVTLGSGAGNGGPAFFTRYAVHINLAAAQIWSGGGGGGGSPTGGGGGGGAGQDPGLGGGSTLGSPGNPGTDTAGGLGGASGGFGGSPGANGGGPGLPGGGGGFVFAGGVAGAAIDGLSHLIVTGVGDIRGAQIN